MSGAKPGNGYVSTLAGPARTLPKLPARKKNLRAKIKSAFLVQNDFLGAKNGFLEEGGKNNVLGQRNQFLGAKTKLLGCRKRLSRSREKVSRTKKHIVVVLKTIFVCAKKQTN